MSKLRLILLASLISIITATGLAALGTQRADAYTCLRPSNAQPRISTTSTQATAIFTFPEECRNKNIKITLVSYKAPNNVDAKPYEQQVYFKSVTRQYNITGQRQITVGLPDCFYQVDLVLGEPLMSFAGGVTYHAQHRFLLAKIGGNKPCFQQPAAPTAMAQPQQQPPPEAPAMPQAPAPSVNIQNTNTNTNTNVNTVSADKARVAAAKAKAADEQPAAPQAPAPAVPSYGSLPDTGPGQIAAISFGFTSTAGILFAYRRRFDDIVASIISRF